MAEKCNSIQETIQIKPCTKFFEPMLYLLALGYGLGGFVKEINGLSYLQFIAPGIVMSSAMYAASYECTYGTYVRMEYQKTFDAIMATPILFDELVLGELLWGATKSLIYGTIIVLIISLFGVVSSYQVLFLIPYIFACGLLCHLFNYCHSPCSRNRLFQLLLHTLSHSSFSVFRHIFPCKRFNKSPKRVDSAKSSLSPRKYIKDFMFWKV